MGYHRVLGNPRIMPCSDGPTREIPEISRIILAKPENSRKLDLTYQIKGLSMLVHLDTLKFGNSGKILDIFRKMWENWNISGKIAKFCINNVLRKPLQPIGRYPASFYEIKEGCIGCIRAMCAKVGHDGPTNISTRNINIVTKMSEELL